jgi:fumarate reductase flavoprotein subunit
MSLEKNEKGLTRRKFIQTAIAVGGGGAVLMEFGPREANAVAPPKKWDKEAGVVVIGTGAAGLSAAIEAKNAGADVWVLEKMPFLGGNTGISTAGMNAVQSKLQKERGVKSWTVDEFYEWTRMGGDYKNKPDQVRVFAKESGNVIDFLAGLGAPFRRLTYRSQEITNKWGAGLVELLAKRVAQMKIPILTETKVTALIADVSKMPKKVLGVKATDRKGKALNIRAKKAVLLATGGFGANPELVERYDPTLKGYATSNIPGVSTGECQMMAQSLGADIDGINYIQIHPTVYAFEGKRALITEGVRTAGGILVNQDGHRFVDEEHRRDEVAQAILKQKGKYAYLIASKNVAHGKITEYIQDGFVVQANTLEELAQKIGIDPEKFVQTINKYNGYVEAKNDPEFKRGLYREMGKKQVFPGKIETPPFYSLKVTPGIHHTCGGLRINSKGQVMDAIEGNVVIQKLYAAGEVIGGTHGTNRMGGNAITDCIVFGRIAGMHAAKEMDKTK